MPKLLQWSPFQEAFNKCFVADFIFSISRTVEDKNTNSGRIFIAKNRNGPDGLVYPIFMDTSNVKIRVSNSLRGDTIAQASHQVVKKQAETLKEKYKEFRKSTKKEKEK